MIALAQSGAVAATGSFHFNFGDVPTWLGVIAASSAAYFVYGQLRGQREDFGRELRALERQQADQIDVRFVHDKLSDLWPSRSSPKREPEVNSRCR